jgi:hypothetical protein
MRAPVFSVALLLALACGRTPLLEKRPHDAGVPRPDSAWNPDAVNGLADAAGDGARPDERSSWPEAGPEVACAALASLADRGVLTPRHAKQVLFAKDRRSLVLRVAGVDAGTDDDVLLIHLPEGDTAPLGIGVVGINWIARESRVLLRNRAGDLIAFPLDGGDSAILAQRTCGHVVSPDGDRVLTLEDCDDRSATLVSVDAQTGTRAPLGRTARTPYDVRPNAVFSPNGQWVAYREPATARDGRVAMGGLIYVVDARNRSYALTSTPEADNPVFASDGVLLFATNSSGPASAVDIRAHVLGSGDTSRVIARGVDFQSAFGLRVSPDGQWILAAVIPLPNGLSSYAYALSAYSIDGKEVALAADLFPFWSTQMLVYSFAFAADNRHVVYLTSGIPRGTSAVALSGGQTTALSADVFFTIPPTGNLVALSETLSSPMRVRLNDLDTNRDLASAEAGARPTRVTFTPDGRSVIFIEQTEGATPSRLRHLSGRTGVATTLANWNSNQLAVGGGLCCNEPDHSYPIDPTGCFTVVDSDIEGGTRLILLPESSL